MLRILLTLLPVLLCAPSLYVQEGLYAQASVSKAQQLRFTLQPGDAIRVAVWREADLSGDFPVDEQGVTILPLLGPRQVAGVPIEALRKSLLEDFRVHIVNPSVTITPLRRISILGEVPKPGVYSVDPTVSLAQAIALAGGATPSGDLRKVRVVRGNEVLRGRIDPGVSLTTADIRSGDQIFVLQRNWFQRNSTFVVSVLISATSIVISLIR